MAFRMLSERDVAETTIAWADYSFNAWWGCTKVSPACTHCYAEAWAKRTGFELWGDAAPRRFFGEKHWLEPFKWAKAAREGFVFAKVDGKVRKVPVDHKPRVFVNSMSDVGEDRRDLDHWRDKLAGTIELTSDALDWLLLTKRPENLVRLVDKDALALCWVGTTAEEQKRADHRIPHLLATPAAVRFLSCEPLLGPVDLRSIRNGGDVFAPFNALACRIDWVIAGGESGPKARPSALEWHTSLRDQCRAAGVAFFEKQLGACVVSEKRTVSAEDFKVLARGGLAHPRWLTEDGPKEWRAPNGEFFAWRAGLKDRAGADPSEWPEDMRVREFPR